MSILNMTLTCKFRTFLLCVVAPIALWSGSLLGGYLRMEGQSAWMNKELVERAERIEMLQNDVEALQGLVDYLDLKLELSEQTPEEVEATATEIIQEHQKSADSKAAYARLYTHESATSDGKVGRITYSPTK